MTGDKNVNYNSDSVNSFFFTVTLSFLINKEKLVMPKKPVDDLNNNKIR
jgi:hypothetical protein